jgi:V8-like Glu-specific endopeptidase
VLVAVPASGQETEPLYLQQTVPAVDVEALRELAGDDAPEVLEQLFLRELLRTAPPAPMPREVKSDKISTFDPAALSVITKDVLTGEETVVQSDVMPYLLESSGIVEPFLPDVPQFAAGPVEASAESAAKEMIPVDPNAITPTVPTPLENTTTFPWNTIVKLLMRFNSGGTNYYYVCSGGTVSAVHNYMIWTAGHCVYNHDPNNDGSTSDQRAVDELWAWPAQTDRVYRAGLGVSDAQDWPYGVAKMTARRYYVGWADSSDINLDFGWVTLDRRIGSRVGSMGWQWGTVATSLNFDGYPTETPYVPAGEMRQYPGFDSGNVVLYTSSRIRMDAFTYGGHSGGPVWRFVSSTGDRYIHGVNSTSDRAGSATAQRVTENVNDVTNTAKTEDDAARLPVARPELIEYVLSTTAKDLLTNTVHKGETIQVEYNAYNVGFASTTVTVDFYLSINDFISTSDYKIGSRTFTLGANAYLNTTTTLNVPLTVPARSAYYVGWIMNSSVAEYANDGSRSWAVIGPETLEVTNPPPDLHVPAFTISQSLLCEEQTFTANATVENQTPGSTAPGTTLTYRRSTNSTISTSDAVAGTDPVASLAGGETSLESAPITSPATPGTWYTGACVDSVSGETAIDNQCFTPGSRIVVIPDTLTITTGYYSGTVLLRAAYSISVGAATVGDGGDVVFSSEELIFDNGFQVLGSGNMTAAYQARPAGCP